MPEDDEPVCDCGDEPPDPEPGCGSGEGSSSSEGGGDTCPPGYVSCGATGGTFIIDSDVEWTWVNNDGCPEGCVAFKAEQPTAEEEAAGVAPGDFSYDGICCELEPGCCKHYICANNDGVWQYVYHEDSPSDEADCTAANDSAGIGSPNSPCDADPSNILNNYYIWSSDPCPAGCCTHWNCIGGDPFYYQQGTPYDSSEANCIMLITEFNGDPSLPCNSTPRNYNNTYNTWSAGSCVLSVPSDGPVEVMERPCYQEECNAHVSTWMAEPFGEPNEEGLYKVKWILLDGCPGACCSDQPTQPEFVKKSELIDAPCKCGCS